MNPETPATSLSATAWPGAFHIYAATKKIAKPNAWTLFGMYILFTVVSLAVNLSFRKAAGLSVIGTLIQLAISGFETAFFTSLFLLATKQGKVSVDQAFKHGMPFVLKLIGLNILVGISVIVSALLLIVPAFFVFPRLYLAPYYMIDRNLGVIDAYKTCWNESKGNLGKVWGIIGFKILIGLLFITIIGIPFSIYFLLMYSSAYVVLFRFMTGDVSVLEPVGAPAAQ